MNIKTNFYIYIIALLVTGIFFSLQAQDKSKKETPLKRNYYSTTFYNENDSVYTTRIFSNLMHYKTDSGAYQPINKNIQISDSGAYNYEVTQGIYKAYFKSNITSPFPIRYETRDGSFLYLQPFALAFIDKKTEQRSIIADVKPGAPLINENTITYVEAFPNVDIRYTYKEKRLKEEIILKDGFREGLSSPKTVGFKKNKTDLVVLNYLEFSDELNVDEVDSLNLKTRLKKADLKNYKKKAHLKFSKKGKTKFTIPIDLAYSGKADTSAGKQETIKLERRIVEFEGRQQLLTSIDYKKLLAFSTGDIIIDPSIDTQVGASEDVWLENSSNKNWYSMFLVGKDRNYPKKRSLVKFDVSSIPTSAQILAAELNIYYYKRGGKSTVYPWIDRPVRAYRMTRDWNESQATSIKATSSVNWSSTLAEGDYNPVHEDESIVTLTYGWHNFSIPTMVWAWVSDVSENKGLILKATNEDSPGYDVRFCSSEYSSTTFRPYLDITYKREFNKDYYLKDHLGNIRVTVDEDGEVVTTDDYYPFGLQMPYRSYNIAATGDIYKYSSKELDVENNLNWYYFGARYYDPEIGRWLSVDPMAHKFPYSSSYVAMNNNPLRYIDPNGMEWYEVTEEYQEEETDDVGNTTSVIKTRKVWKWFEDTSEKEIWTGNYDSDGNKVFETVAGKSDAGLYFHFLLENAAEQFGIKDLAAMAMVVSGLPILEKRFIMEGASGGTSIASKYLSKIPGRSPFGLPSITGSPKALGGRGMRIALTKSIGRFAGRAVPILGWGILAYDAGMILYNTQSQFNSVLNSR